MGTPETKPIALSISDVTGQQLREVADVPPDSTIGELVQSLLVSMSLPQTDVVGRPLVYQALNESEGKSLHASERVGEALRSGDRVVLAPSIDAGGGE